MRAPIVWRMIGALVVGAASTASAQVKTRVVVTDSARKADSLLKGDSLMRKPDTLSTDDRLLKLSKENRVQLQPLSRCGVTSLLPRGSRTVFDRDSIDWAPAQSVGELLATIPGVFVKHADWSGMPEMPDLFGRGVASVEYVVDCVPYLPIGPDSTGVEPTVVLDMLERVEVEQSPGMIRVFLFTLRHSFLAPRTKIGASQGDRGNTRYWGSFEHRYAGGLGLSVGASYLGLNAAPDNTGGGNTPSGWLQLSYAPSVKFGVQAQLITQLYDRNTLLAETTHDTLLRMFKGTRTDEQVRVSLRQHADGLGSSLDLFLARSLWSSDSMPTARSFGEFGLIAARRAPTWSAQISAWHYTRITSLDTRLDLGWNPIERVSGSLQLVGQRHDGNRSSQWATARVGFGLPAGFSVGGVVSDGRRVQSPTLLADLGQRFTDAELIAGFHSRILAIDAGYVTNEAWQPQAFQEFVAVPALGPLARTKWVTAHVRLSPTNWFTLESRFQNPLDNAMPDGAPPQHFLSTATIRSRFLHNFPSGIFGLKIQGVFENWGAGIGGRDAQGVAITLPAATFFRAIVQFQIGPFIAYYDQINLGATRTGYVPKYPIQVPGQTFGIRWEFRN